jgi:hypothetical protein
VAALLKHDLGVDAELVEGKRSEFTVWVGDGLVAEKSWSGFPSDEDVVAGVRAALGR